MTSLKTKLIVCGTKEGRDARYSASSIIQPCWATFFQNLGQVRKVSIVGYPPSTTYTTLKGT